MTDGADDSDLLIPVPPEPELRLGAYSDDEDVVTQQVEALLVEPRWLVQISSLDRRMLETSQLVAGLLNGTIRSDALVWRGGMDDWLPASRLDLLAPSELPTQPPRRRMTRPPAARLEPFGALLASLAIACSSAAVTTSALLVAGVFEPHAARPPRAQAQQAERRPEVRDEAAGQHAVQASASPSP